MSAPQRDVSNWLDQSKPQDSCNTPAQPRDICVPPIETRRDEFCDHPKPAPANVLNTNEPCECSLFQGQSSAGLFNPEYRLPKPKITQFHGDPKSFKHFMECICSNVDEVTEEFDSTLKLTLLLDHCTGQTYNLIKDCVMYKPDERYGTARSKRKTKCCENNLVARSYFLSVMKSNNFKLNEVKALVKPDDDIGKCRM